MVVFLLHFDLTINEARKRKEERGILGKGEERVKESQKDFGNRFSLTLLLSFLLLPCLIC